MKKYPKRTTPPVTALWAFVGKPATKYNPDGEYLVKGVMEDGPEVRALLKEIEGWMDEARAEAVKEKPIRKSYQTNLPIQPEVDENTGDETGRWIISAKSKNPPTVVDAKKQPAPGCNPGGGSLLRLGLGFGSYAIDGTKTIGIKAYLNAVQVLSLVAPGSDSAAAYDFDEEDGYIAPEPESLTTPGAADDSHAF